MSRRVAVTGMGLVCPVGNTVDSAWKNIVAGVSGIAPITCIDVSKFSAQIGGNIKDFNVEDFIPKKEARRMDPFIHYGLAASIEAIEHAGLEITADNAHRVGACIGSGIGGLPGIEHAYQSYLDGGPRKVSPFFVPGNIINMVAGNLSIRYGFRGPNYAIVTACSTGAHCIANAARMIQYGDVDAMIAGGSEFATSYTGLGGFSSAKALSTRNDDPEGASRPWDLNRDGFVLSDGAGILVLEEMELAQKRGATVYAELLGSAMSSDAFHITAPAEDGEGAALCMEWAIQDANINRQDVDYINAHGTSTPAGDKAETDAVKRYFGDHAQALAISSTKSMVGHMLGAAGGAEAVFTVLSIRDQVAPPTINLDTPDPDCDLDYVPLHAREMRIDVAITNSFGFGGTNGTLVFQRV